MPPDLVVVLADLEWNDAALIDRGRPTLMVRAVGFPVEDLHDAPPADAAYLFSGGWACLDRMDERRADDFRRALAGTAQTVTPNGVAWSAASAEACERLRRAWTRDPRPAPG